MDRFRRSFALVAESYRVLMQDKELMILPLISGFVILLLLVGVFMGFGLHEGDLSDSNNAVLYVPMFVLYVATYFIGTFFQAAVIAGATERMRGGDPTVASALAAAGRRAGAILLWSLFAATVGMILRVIQDRMSFVGRIIVSIIGVAWSLATFFVVPVLVLDDMPVTESFRKSTDLFRATWGEAAAGGVSLGLASLAAWITLIVGTGVLAWLGLGIAAIGVGALGAIALVMFFSAMQGVYVASLYQYAIGGDALGGFDRDTLQDAFARR